MSTSPIVHANAPRLHQVFVNMLMNAAQAGDEGCIVRINVRTGVAAGQAFIEFRDQSRIAHDLDAVGQEFTSRGEMVRKLVDHTNESRPGDQVAGRALQLALDAFEE